METDKQWRRCSTCKKSIPLGAMYWVCNVSTCNRKRTGMVFCSTACWDVHVPVMNHRESWCIEKKAPLYPETDVVSKGSVTSSQNSQARSVSTENFQKSTESTNRNHLKPLQSTDDTEILVVASKVKDYIRSCSGCNTSASALSALSDFVRRESDLAIEKAKGEGRSTVLGRDVLPRSQMGGSNTRSHTESSSKEYKKSGVVIRRRE